MPARGEGGRWKGRVRTGEYSTAAALTSRCRRVTKKRAPECKGRQRTSSKRARSRLRRCPQNLPTPPRKSAHAWESANVILFECGRPSCQCYRISNTQQTKFELYESRCRNYELRNDIKSVVEKGWRGTITPRRAVFVDVPVKHVVPLHAPRRHSGAIHRHRLRRWHLHACRSQGQQRARGKGRGRGSRFNHKRTRRGGRLARDVCQVMVKK